jgi:predicted alpha/beta-fold hydrolase
MTALRKTPDSAYQSVQSSFPAFEPHPWFRGKHGQTILGRYWGSLVLPIPATRAEIALPDSDRLVVLDSAPRVWKAPRAAVVIVHGLAGNSEAPYVIRLARRLLQSGIRVIRVNLRGAGAGFGLARGIYHAGRSDDLRHVMTWAGSKLESSPIGLVGFSLGANLALKLAAESSTEPIPNLDCVVAANPPLNLAACAREIERPENRVYNWNFVRSLLAMIKRLHNRFPDLGPVDLTGVKTLYDFDDRYTAPRNNFGTAANYYAKCSLDGALLQIPQPGLIVHAQDDPFIPLDSFVKAERPPQLALELVSSGGHLGYVSRNRWRGDRHWLEARLCAWLLSRWALR